MQKQTLQQFLDQTISVLEIHLETVRGSTPRDAGTYMYLNPTQIWGSIGGGQLEHRVIEHGRAMLANAQHQDRLTIPLGPEIGQCCGGSVTVSLVHMSANDRMRAIDQDKMNQINQPSVYVLGAGHVGRALADQLQYLPVKCILIDTRETELSLNDAQVETRLTALPEHDIMTAAPNSTFVIMTHDHGLDFTLTSAALARKEAAYVGMIGSASKRAQLANWCKPASIDQVTCPIGATNGHDKRPSIIAAYVTAEILKNLETRAKDMPVSDQSATVYQVS